MLKTKKERIRKHYLKEHATIISAMNSESREQTIDLDGDDIDHIQGMAISQLATRLSLRDLARLQRIEVALVKLGQKDFGECEACGKQIGERRLMVIPGVENCIECAEEVEQQAKQFAVG